MAYDWSGFRCRSVALLTSITLHNTDSDCHLSAARHRPQPLQRDSSVKVFFLFHFLLVPVTCSRPLKRWLNKCWKPKKRKNCTRSERLAASNQVLFLLRSSVSASMVSSRASYIFPQPTATQIGRSRNCHSVDSDGDGSVLMQRKNQFRIWNRKLAWSETETLFQLAQRDRPDWYNAPTATSNQRLMGNLCRTKSELFHLFPWFHCTVVSSIIATIWCEVMFAHLRCMWVGSVVCASDVSLHQLLATQRNTIRIVCVWHVITLRICSVLIIAQRPRHMPQKVGCVWVSEWLNYDRSILIHLSILKVFSPKDGILTKLECPQWLPDHLINKVSGIAFDWTEIVHLHLSRSSSSMIFVANLSLTHTPALAHRGTAVYSFALMVTNALQFIYEFIIIIYLSLVCARRARARVHMFASSIR